MLGWKRYSAYQQFLVNFLLPLKTKYVLLMSWARNAVAWDAYHINAMKMILTSSLCAFMFCRNAMCAL